MTRAACVVLVLVGIVAGMLISFACDDTPVTQAQQDGAPTVDADSTTPAAAPACVRWQVRSETISGTKLASSGKQLTANTGEPFAVIPVIADGTPLYAGLGAPTGYAVWTRTCVEFATD